MGRESLTQIQKSLIIGTILGDGNLENRKLNASLRIDHGENQKEYLFWKYDLLRNIATKEPVIIEEAHKQTGKVYVRWHFRTKALPELNFYWNLFYPTRKKIVPVSIAKYLNAPLALAVWIMDDGYLRNDCNAFRFNTDGFSYKEQFILQDCLKGNFGIDSKLHKKGSYWNIYIPMNEMMRLRAIVAPYLVPSMSYKLSPRNDFISTSVEIG